MKSVEETLRTTGGIRVVAVVGRILHEIRMRDSIRCNSPEWCLLSEAIERIYALDVDNVANTDL